MPDSSFKFSLVSTRYLGLLVKLPLIWKRFTCQLYRNGSKVGGLEAHTAMVYFLVILSCVAK